MSTPDPIVEPVFILLSARDESVLRAMVKDLHAFLDEEGDNAPSLDRIAYTLQVGREQMDVRLVVEAATRAGLMRELARLATLEALGTNSKMREGLAALTDDQDMHQLVERWISKRAMRKLADAWLSGFKIDWPVLHAGTAPKRVNLPTYPFKQQRYWITESRGRANSEKSTDATKAPADLRQASGSDKKSTNGFDGHASGDLERVTAVQPGKLNGSHSLFSVPETHRAQEPDPVALSVVTAIEISPPVQQLATVSTNKPPAEIGREVTIGELQDQLSRGLAAALFMDDNDVDLDETFFELGVESVSGVEWIRDLNERYGVTLKVSAIYDFPTLRTFAEYLHEKLGERPGGLFVPLQEMSPVPALREPASAEPPPRLAAQHVARDPEPGDSGTVDVRRAEMEASARSDVEAIVAPLLEDLAETLVIDPAFLEPDQMFEEMGVDPARLPALARRISERHGVAVRPADLVEHATPRSLAAHIAAMRGETAQIAESATSGENCGLAIVAPSGIDRVVMSSWRVSAPAPGEVTIAVKASAVNFADAMCVTGLYPTMPDYPFVVGMEVSGIVAAVAADVHGFSAGDEVVAVTGQSLGGHASEVNVPAPNVVRKPRGTTFEEAVSLPVAFLTMRAAFEAARLADGESILMHTATGGCGLMALQLARLQHCTLYASTSKHDKRWKLKLLGIDDVVDYNQPFDEKILAWTKGRGVDVVVNTVPGAAIQRGLNCLAPSGRYVELAVQALKSARKLDLSRLVDNQSLHSIDMRRMGSRGGANGWVRETLTSMVEMVEAGDIVPIVSRVYPREHIAQAIKCVSLGEHVGKVVVGHDRTTAENCEDTCLERMQAQQQTAVRKTTQARLPARTVQSAVAATPERIAVIGMVGQFPMANSSREFWQNLVDGRYCVGGLPYERWKMPRPENGASALYPYTGVLEEADAFDPLFFNISPKEARLMDPQQRVFLQNCWSCIEDAGYAPSSLAGARCGVFAGCSGAGYGFGRIQETSTHVLMGHTNSILPARISYHLNLKGPCMAIDTACSSALVALAEACTSLAFGACDLALAGGVSIFASPIFSKMAAEGGMLSEDGRCYTFDKRANGFVPAEGVGVFLLKRLSDAVRDGDHVQGVVSAWGVNHDGKTNGMTAPSVVSQTALECEVYERFAIDPETISYVEAHGTGTRLGDPIEVQGLTEAFRRFTPRKQFCGLGSVKSNIGHALAAAAAAGVLKVLLALQHRTLPASINYESLNDEISLDDSPFYVQAQTRPWNPPPNAPRRAAVSSFSYNGTNAHVVIEDYLSGVAAEAADAIEAHPILISARVEEQLRDQVARLLGHAESLLGGHLTPRENRSRLRDMAYTLQIGRDAMAERIAFVSSTLDELVATLRELKAGRTPVGCRVGNIRAAKKLLDREDRTAASERRASIESALAARDLAPLLEQWMSGAAVDWRKLHDNSGARRIPLPTYPFAKKRYWFDDSDGDVRAPAIEKPVSRLKSDAAPVGSLDRRFETLLGKLQQDRPSQPANAA